MINKMKRISILVAFLLIFSIAIPIFDVTTSAHTPPWQIPVTAYLTVTPNPVGVGQTVAVVMWNDRPLQGGALYTYTDVRHYGYKLIITKPDGTNDTQTWGVITDTTAAQFYSFTPTEIGNYSFVFYYPGLLYTWNRTTTQQLWTNDTFLPATSEISHIKCTRTTIANTKSSYPTSNRILDKTH